MVNPRICPDCGDEFDGGDNFCRRCGYTLGVYRRPEQPAQQQLTPDKLVSMVVLIVAAAFLWGAMQLQSMVH